MASNPSRTPMYPEIDHPIHENAPSLYPTINIDDFASNQGNSPRSPIWSPSAPPLSTEDIIITIPGAILHLIDKNRSIPLAAGDFKIIFLRQGDNTVAALASVSDAVVWPLAKDIATVKLDSSHYFFSFQAPNDSEDKKKNKAESEVLSYGLTIVCKGQEGLVKELDGILESCSNFTVHEVEEKVVVAMGETAKEVSVGELEGDERKKEEVEGQCAAYWTTLAPNVEDYSGTAARLIATGSGQLVKGILWCGDVTIDRLKWGNEVLKDKMGPSVTRDIDPETLKRIQRVKTVTKMTEKVANGVLCGVVKVSGFFASSVAKSKVGKKFLNYLPEEVIVASLDGFSKLCDAVEVSGRHVMSTSSTVTTGLVTHKYGEEAGKAASEGLDAAGYAVGAAWAMFNIRKAFNPKSALGPALAKAATADTKGKGK